MIVLLFRYFLPKGVPKEKCSVCGEIKPVSEILGVCKDCIVNRFDEALPYLKEAHKNVRSLFGLPAEPPKSDDGILCNLCSNECRMGVGERGFCGLRWNENGKLISYSTPNRAPLYAYLDPHVTNCCAAWFCPAATGIGFPKFAARSGAEKGYYNLAVFFYGCNFSCLFCQNWEHKRLTEGNLVKAEELARMALNNEKITCICYFGGSPEPHLPYTIRVNDIIIKEKPDNRVLRICYEWNGAGNPILVRKVGEQVLVTGGIIKFDLKAPNPELNFALTGVRNERVFENFKMLYDEFWDERPEIPIITATTLLVPGYIGPDEVEQIAKFIGSIDENIPYSLLIFHPDFKMTDLPVTPKKVVYEAYERAKKYLKKVHIGNMFLLASAPENI